jgi:hypothetical protein
MTSTIIVDVDMSTNLFPMMLMTYKDVSLYSKEGILLGAQDFQLIVTRSPFTTSIDAKVYALYSRS